jgi:alanine racemase
MLQTSQLHIDLTAIDHNMRLLRRLVGPQVALCPILKADGYGLGAGRIGRQLAHSGAEMLAVYAPRQAAELAADLTAASIDLPILVLMPVRHVEPLPELQPLLLRGALHLTIHDEAQLVDLSRLADLLGVKVPVHLEVDTGMSRGGCGLDDAPQLLRIIAGSPRLALAGLFTHFACADSDDSFTQRQFALFEDLVQKHRSQIPSGCLTHAANSHATIRHGRYHKSMVRVGLAWAGYAADGWSGSEMLPEARQLRPCLTWSSRIVHVKTIEPGTRVGYGARWTAARRSRIGLVPVGYADGYPTGLGAIDARADFKGATVAVLKRDGGVVKRIFAPVVGAINMDQITIDLTDTGPIEVGATVELITPDPAAPNHLPRLAESAGTVPLDLLCRLNPRLGRVYEGAVEGLGRGTHVGIPGVASRQVAIK